MSAAVEYPPAHHVLRDLRFAMEHHGAERARLTLPVVDELRDGDGCVPLGVLAFAVDVVGGGLAALAARPDWIATADLTLHAVRLPVGTEVAVDALVLRRGRTTVVLEVTLSDDGEVVGLATMSFAILPRRDSNPVVEPAPEGVTRMTAALATSHLRQPLATEIGLEVVDEPSGTVEAPLTDYTRNSLGALQGGVLAFLVDRAAAAALRAASGAELSPVDLHLSYLALGTHGPFRTNATVLSATADHGTARVEVVDHGRGRRTALARIVATMLVGTGRA